MGPTAKEPAFNYERALALSQTLTDRGRERFLATWGVWFSPTMSGQTVEALRCAEDLLAIARELDDSDLLVEAYHARTPGLLRVPDFAALKESAQEVIRLYDRERHRDHAYYFGGHDSRVCALSFYAVSLWGLGFPDQAQRMAQQCIEDARNLGHAFSLAHGLNMGGLTYLLLNDVEACRAIADELYPLAERNKFPWPLAYARFQRGWLMAKEKTSARTGIEQMLQGGRRCAGRRTAAAGAGFSSPRNRCWPGQFEAAIATLDRATDAVKKHAAQSIL